MSATGTLGRIEEFDGSKDEWPLYVERLEHIFTANGIDGEEKRRAMLLSVVGASTYKVLRNIVSPNKPGDKTYSALVTALSQHFKPTPSEIVERFKFHSRARKAGESVATYVAELRSLTEFCNFGDMLEVMIHDRLVCGINDPAIQKRLLAEPELTYAKAVEVAQNTETAAQSMRELRAKPEGDATLQQPTVNKTSTTSPASGDAGAPAYTCYRCGKKGHVVASCRLSKDVVCHYCNKRGHVQRACKSKARSSPRKPGKRKTRTVGRVHSEGEDESGTENGSTLYQLRSRGGASAPPIIVEVTLDDCLVNMEVDTGASHSLMSESTFSRLWPGRSLQPTPVRLRSYTKEPIAVLGCCNVNVHYRGQTGEMPLLIVAGTGPTLLGRDWLCQIQLNWKEIHQVHSSSLQSLLARYSSVFEEGLGMLKGFKAKIYVDPDAPPRFHRARSVPYALREKVDKELQRLQDEGTLEPVEIAEWATPIVAVLKRDKSSVRICGDFSVTVNPVSKLDRYPIPRVEDLFSRLSKGKLFSKLDLSQAYQQLPLDEASKQYVVINTHRGLFRYTRLPFGISSAPGIFQRGIESLLQGIEGVVVYLDDILVTGSTEEHHLQTLEEVLNRLDGAGLRVKQSKCDFLKESVTYLGHRINANGLHPLQD